MRAITTLLLLAELANGFIFRDLSTQKPGLTQLVDAQGEQTLSVTLDIGKEGSESRMAVKGMVLGLHNDKPDYEHVAMPGKNGPNPKLSSGIRALNMIQEGHFISKVGTELVHTLKGCWEMVWRKDAPAGALLCGFDLPDEYQRNEAKLPKGRLYLSFPVWTAETLAFAQTQKVEILGLAEAALKEKEDQFSKYAAATNPLTKALHYRNAYAALEKYWMYPVDRMKQVPTSEEVIKIQDDLFLTTKGLVW
eukprot:CAMPEP_0117032932 /NCGR_PEP_ID=MMETSP0472-20121206/23571_1 /TAXON_ID=693140 ORGANISM="Tiarina fusus, Strain LIS" /NCGR_SAMPLE_ID=MMETSP0472 /ASSEMBLY_ACC=CAM_ASM_000603 /LENGTH=249 /DNA_ID=CAMNT_0004741713 /DNA_START=107 /DNA_END=853 /DNA_ORIENTATION=-